MQLYPVVPLDAVNILLLFALYGLPGGYRIFGGAICITGIEDKILVFFETHLGFNGIGAGGNERTHPAQRPRGASLHLGADQRRHGFLAASQALRRNIGQGARVGFGA